jgi:hypothetical protein
MAEAPLPAKSTEMIMQHWSGIGDWYVTWAEPCANKIYESFVPFLRLD